MKRASCECVGNAMHSAAENSFSAFSALWKIESKMFSEAEQGHTHARSNFPTNGKTMSHQGFFSSLGIGSLRFPLLNLAFHPIRRREVPRMPKQSLGKKTRNRVRKQYALEE